MSTLERPIGSYEKQGRDYDRRGKLIEVLHGRWREVVDAGRLGWWRFNEHYDRNGYCDNPGRGY